MENEINNGEIVYVSTETLSKCTNYKVCITAATPERTLELWKQTQSLLVDAIKEKGLTPAGVVAATQTA